MNQKQRVIHITSLIIDMISRHIVDNEAIQEDRKLKELANSALSSCLKFYKELSAENSEILPKIFTID